jgi:hypothetical protein
LDSPRILSASARQVQIRVASTVPATTTIREVAGVLFPLPHLVALPQAAIARGTRVASIPPSLVMLNAHVQIQGTPVQGPYQVGLKPIVITLNVAAGQKPLYFKLDLQAEGLTTTRFIRIGRD